MAQPFSLSTINVFVYGTLKPGEFNHPICAEYIQAIQPAIAHGWLYELPFGYPAMTLDDRGRVVGYVLQFTNPIVLSILDRLEQHDPDQFHRLIPDQPYDANQYQRVQFQTYTPKQEPFELAWGYVMTQNQIQCLRGIAVSSGDWQGAHRNQPAIS